MLLYRKAYEDLKQTFSIEIFPAVSCKLDSQLIEHFIYSCRLYSLIFILIPNKRQSLQIHKWKGSLQAMCVTAELIDCFID